MGVRVRWLSWLALLTGGLTVTAAALAAWQLWLPTAAWTAPQLAQIHSLSLQSLPPVPPDPGNAVADHPQARQLGHAVFFDPRFSATGTISCATCHQPALDFTDGLPVSRAIGRSKRNAPSIISSVYSPWLYWDGRKDSLWSQALAPLEDPAEHGGDRLQYLRIVYADAAYRSLYEQLFGPMPDLADPQRFPLEAAAAPIANAAWLAMQPRDRQAVNRAFANLGKTIAAYERLLLPGTSRFDRYAARLSGGQQPAADFSNWEKRGLALFIGAANCTQCHNGPLLTNNAFHNTGLLSVPGHIPDKGRVGALQGLRADPFNCLGEYNDATDRNCDELLYAKDDKELVGAFRTPSLRNLARTAPYGHAGQHATLDAALQHYNQAPDAMIGHNEAKPLALWPWQIYQLRAFLESLQAPPDVAPRWLQPPP